MERTLRCWPSREFNGLRRRGVGTALVVALLSFSACAVLGQESPSPATVDFATQIKPIFEAHCIRCHGPNKEEGFQINDRDTTLGYIEPGDASSSTLYELITSDDETELMPPSAEGIPLSREQIRLVRNWINQGAEWPESVELVDPADAELPEIAEDLPVGQRIWLASGALHPALSHLPIGLLMGAGFFALFSLRGNFVMSDCAYYCLWLGAIAAVLASVAGWSYAITTSRGAEIEELFNPNVKIFWHRISGLAISLLAVLLALFAAAARSRDPDNGVWWKLGTILIAIGIGWTGYTGGKLHYGDKHYQRLNELIDSWTGWNWSGTDPQPVDQNRGNGAAEVGNTSQESGEEEESSNSESGDPPQQPGAATDPPQDDGGSP